MQGTSFSRAFECLFVAILPIFMSFIATNIYPYFVQNERQWKRMLAVDFVTITLPVLCSVTILVNHVLMINVAAAVTCVFLVLVKGGNGGEKRKEDTRRPFLTNNRGSVLMISMTLILAVDFRIFARQFMKSYRYGANLMDTGIVLYQLINGTTYFTKANKKKTLKSTAAGILIALGLGTVRYASVTLVGYNVNVLEYGTHWNFFFTVGLTLIVYEIAVLLPWNGVCGLGLKGLAIIVFHQIMLSAFLEDWVFSDIPRDNFISANREGIVQTVGLSGTFILFIAYSYLFIETDPYKLYPRLALVTILLSVSTYFLVVTFDVSRTCANIGYLSYCVWMGSIMVPLHYTFELVHKKFYSAQTPSSPFVMEAINYNSLLFFILGNTFTGLYNVFFDSFAKSPIEAMVHLGLYMLLNTLIVSVMYVKKIQLKF